MPVQRSGLIKEATPPRRIGVGEVRIYGHTSPRRLGGPINEAHTFLAGDSRSDDPSAFHLTRSENRRITSAGKIVSVQGAGPASIVLPNFHRVANHTPGYCQYHDYSPYGPADPGTLYAA